MYLFLINKLSETEYVLSEISILRNNVVNAIQTFLIQFSLAWVGF